MLPHQKWLLGFMLVLCLPMHVLQADIKNWQTGETIPGTEGITPGPGIDLSNWNTPTMNLEFADLADTNLEGANFHDSVLSYAWFQRANLMNARFTHFLAGGSLLGADLTQANLTGASFSRFGLANANFTDSVAIGAGFDKAFLSGANMSGADLTNADFQWSDVTNTNFSGAVVAGSRFGPDITGFTKEQLYSTASYVDKHLEEIELYHSDFSDADFAGHNLSGAFFAALNLVNADFTDAQLIGADISVDLNVLQNADFSRADLRDAFRFEPDPTSRTDNVIWPDSEIRGLALSAGDALTVRGIEFISPADRDVVAVTGGMAIGDGATLHLVRQQFDGGLGSFASTPNLSIASNIPIELGGTLLVSGVLPDIGETLDLFDWPEPLAVGNTFSQVELPPGTVWDLSQLYTTGEITLIPEPANSAMFVIALVSLVCGYRTHCARNRNRVSP
jgi:uncharacterized protein YjbI with pentapeptide repeats